MNVGKEVAFFLALERPGNVLCLFLRPKLSSIGMLYLRKRKMQSVKLTSETIVKPDKTRFFVSTRRGSVAVVKVKKIT